MEQASSASRGRPRKLGAKTVAEASKDYRQSLKAEGKKAVNVYLSAVTREALARICKVKSVAMAEAIEWAVGEAIAFDAVKKSAGPSRIPGLSRKSVREKLIDARAAAVFTEADMADRIQAPLSRYRKWEAGLEKVPGKYLDAVVSLLNLPSDYFSDQ